MTTNLTFKAAAHDAIVRHEKLVKRCRDESGSAGITKLRYRLYDAARARVEAENALARVEHD